MRTKTLAAILMIGFAWAGCKPAVTAITTKAATPISTFTIEDWQEYSSKFTSAVGTIQYSLRYPQDWHVYPGSTKSEPGLEGQTYIQDFERVGMQGSTTSEYQAASQVRLEVYALPCAIVEEGCNPKGLSVLTPNISGTRKIEERAGWTVWTVFLYKKDYRLSLGGYMLGTPQQNDGSLKILDKILSTVVIQ